MPLLCKIKFLPCKIKFICSKMNFMCEKSTSKWYKLLLKAIKLIYAINYLLRTKKLCTFSICCHKWNWYLRVHRIPAISSLSTHYIIGIFSLNNNFIFPLIKTSSYYEQNLNESNSLSNLKKHIFSAQVNATA